MHAHHAQTAATNFPLHVGAPALVVHMLFCCFCAFVNLPTNAYCHAEHHLLQPYTYRSVAGGPISTIQDMPEAKLLKTVERWLRTEKETVQQGASKQPTGTHETKDAVASRATAPSFPSKHMAYFS